MRNGTGPNSQICVTPPLQGEADYASGGVRRQDAKQKRSKQAKLRNAPFAGTGRLRKWRRTETGCVTEQAQTGETA